MQMQEIFSVGESLETGDVVSQVVGSPPLIIQGLVQLMFHLYGSQMAECMYSVVYDLSDKLGDMVKTDQPMTPAIEEELAKRAENIVNAYAEKLNSEQEKGVAR